MSVLICSTIDWSFLQLSFMSNRSNSLSNHITINMENCDPDRQMKKEQKKIQKTLFCPLCHKQSFFVPIKQMTLCKFKYRLFILAQHASINIIVTLTATAMVKVPHVIYSTYCKPVCFFHTPASNKQAEKVNLHDGWICFSLLKQWREGAKLNRTTNNVCVFPICPLTAVNKQHNKLPVCVCLCVCVSGISRRDCSD